MDCSASQKGGEDGWENQILSVNPSNGEQDSPKNLTPDPTQTSLTRFQILSVSSAFAGAAQRNTESLAPKAISSPTPVHSTIASSGKPVSVSALFCVCRVIEPRMILFFGRRPFSLNE
jgi:hypothetical protein